jgi:putative methyltransferase (TIGR04325 family)
MAKGKAKTILKKILPGSLLRFASGIIYGWHGNFDTWEDAKKRCTGYDSELIISKVRSSLISVKNGEAAYERDSVLFQKIQYSYAVLSGMMWIAAQNGGKLNVLDFGGSLGSTYYQNKIFLDSLAEVNWCIVEQPGFVNIGLKEFANDNLHFSNSIEECLNSFGIDVVLFSSVLQYLEEPYKMLASIKSLRIKNIIIDRTPFVSGMDRITIQRVNPSIYYASYPCWFFNKEKFENYLMPEYKLILDFDALDRANIKSEFKGYFYQLSS